MSYYSKEAVDKINDKRRDIDSKCDKLLISYNRHHFLSRSGLEFARHGYMRRVGTLRRCIENVFNLIPVEQADVPNRVTLHDAAINVQAFFANVYGSVDNLAWVWVYERGIESRFAKNQIGFRKKNKDVRATLSDSFRSYMETLDPWLDYVVEYRDALAHRIPLYIPPGSIPPERLDVYNVFEMRMIEALYSQGDGEKYDALSVEQQALLVFQPFVTHSITEASIHVSFHAQMLNDFLTIEEMGYKFLDELS